MTRPLLRALCALAPDAEISVIAKIPWHSLTFAGVRLSFEAIVTGEGHADIAAAFARDLAEHEFDLQSQLVADIAVTARSSSDNRTRLIIEALILDD